MSTGSAFDIFLESSNLIEHYHYWDDILKVAQARGDLPTVTSANNTMCAIYSKLHEAQFKAPIIICHEKWPFKGYSNDGSEIILYKSLKAYSVSDLMGN